MLSQIWSAYRVGAQFVPATASRVPGLKNSAAETYAAQKDEQFARSRVRMFEGEYPALQQKREQQGTRALQISMAGRGPFDPTRDRIINGLISGNADEVSSAMREWLQNVPKAQVADEIKRIKQTITSNAPLKVGGSTKPEAVMDFLAWAHQNLPQAEARRIFALASTYAETAISTGLEDRSKGMQELAKLDYDKFKAPAALSTAQVARQQAFKERQGAALLQQMMRRQQVANQLQGR
jgi:hypothetical protein